MNLHPSISLHRPPPQCRNVLFGPFHSVLTGGTFATRRNDLSVHYHDSKDVRPCSTVYIARIENHDRPCSFLARSFRCRDRAGTSILPSPCLDGNCRTKVVFVVVVSMGRELTTTLHCRATVVTSSAAPNKSNAVHRHAIVNFDRQCHASYQIIA